MGRHSRGYISCAALTDTHSGLLQKRCQQGSCAHGTGDCRITDLDAQVGEQPLFLIIPYPLGLELVLCRNRGGAACRGAGLLDEGRLQGESGMIGAQLLGIRGMHRYNTRPTYL
jgi:hypothetical protein